VSNQPPVQPLRGVSRGVCLFQWTLSDTLGVTDSDKSPWLSVTQTESALTGDYNAATDQNTTKDGCVLTDTVTAPANASAATVQVFGGDAADMAGITGYVPMAQIVAPLPLASLTTNAPGAVSPVWDELSFPEAIQMEEVHLFSAQDSHADIDRGGRKRWALQKNQAPKHPRADNYDIIYTPGADKRAYSWQKKAGYAARANGKGSAGLITSNLVKDRLFFFYGHGSAPHGGQISAGDPPSKIPGNNLAADCIEAKRAFVGQKGFFLEDLNLHNVLLAVYGACYGADTDTITNYGNITQQTVTQGATCAVGFPGFGPTFFDKPGIPTTAHLEWTYFLWQALTIGDPSSVNRKPMNVSFACLFAAGMTKEQIGDYYNTNTVVVKGNGLITIAPIQ
jgi:hypothetical protein